MGSYQRLTILEREEISRGIASGYSFRKIAQILDRSPSSISREIKRSGVVELKYYRGIYGQYRWNKMCHKLRKNRKLNTNRRLKKVVLGHLRRRWSPEQIAKRLILLYPNDMSMHISHETIYSYIYILPKGTLKRRLISYLRRSHKHRRKKRKDYQKGGPITDYISIEQRPKEIADRTIPGHWEGDLIVGYRNASAIGTLVERSTRMTFVVRLANQDSMTIRKAFAEEFRRLPKGLKRTLTYDQGCEMAQHKLFTKETDITVYFTHPRAPWERGTNENTNSLLRQYFPQGTDFNKVSLAKLKQVQDELNDRPRKVLNWYTPHEKFSEVLH